MYRVILTSAPYCYGPTSKVLCLVKELSHFCELTFVGNEPGLSLALAAKLDRVIPLRDRNQWTGEALTALQESDCVVSALDGRAMGVASEYTDKTVFLDTLAWTRHAPLPNTAAVGAYVMQSFFEPVSKNFLGQIDNPHVVGAIFAEAFDEYPPGANRNSTGDVLVNFGGLTSPAMLDNADANFILWCVTALRNSAIPSGELTICIPMHLAGLADRIKVFLPDCKLLTPGLSEFHSYLARARVLITVPGLETVLEALYLDRCVVFLPPHNGTQLLQLRRYLGLGLADAWLPTGSSFDVGRTENLHELTKRVQHFNGRAQGSKIETDRLAGHLRNAVGAFGHSRPTCAGQSLLDRLGVRGRSETIEIINALCER